jgi:D-aspartate ligase
LGWRGGGEDGESLRRKNIDMKGAIIIEGHVQGLSNLRSLGEKGIPVYVIDVCHCLAQHSKYCIKYFKCPGFDTEEFIDFLVELGVREKLDGWVLIPSNDHIVENLSKNKTKLNPYYKTIAPDVSILLNIVNKKNLLNTASRCGVAIPETCYPDTKERVNNFRFPILIKGNLGLSFYKITHYKAIQVDTINEFDSVLNDVLSRVERDNVMIQELIPYDSDNKVVSFTCFAIKGEIKTFWMGDKLREHPVKYGTATYSRSILILDVLASAKPLVKGLEYTGVCEIEFMRDLRDGKYKLIEINPRTWLWVGLAKACGIDYAYMIYSYLNDIPIVFPTSYKVGLKWRNAITDTAYGLKLILNKGITVKEYFKSLRGDKISAIWSWKDIWPGVVFPIMLVYIAKKRG